MKLIRNNIQDVLIAITVNTPKIADHVRIIIYLKIKTNIRTEQNVSAKMNRKFEIENCTSKQIIQIRSKCF